MPEFGNSSARSPFTSEARPQKQQSLDFSRAEQLNLIRRFDPPNRKSKDGIGVSKIVLKSVLRVIDDHARGRSCFMKIGTISDEAHIRPRQAKRAIEILGDIGVLAHETHRCNHYTIVWSELAVAVNRLDLKTAAANQQSSSEETLRETGSALEGTYMRSALNALTAAGEKTEFDTAAAELKNFGIVTAADLTQAAHIAGEPAESFLSRVRSAIEAANDPVNARKLTHPQKAVAWYLAKGVWPVDGICQGEALALMRATQRVAKQNVDQSNRLHTIIRAGRKQGVSDERIKARLHAEFPEEICISHGW